MARARRNMAWPKTYKGVEFDDAEELASFMRAEGRTGAKSKGAPKSKSPKPLRAPKSGNEGAEVSYSQGRIIALAVGGMAKFCPSRAHEKETAAEALTRMGLNYGSASAVISELIAKGFTYGKNTAGAAAVLSAAGVSCSLKNNPIGYPMSWEAGTGIPQWELRQNGKRRGARKNPQDISYWTRPVFF